MDFISIDPGKWAIAWALFEESKLSRCGITKHPGGAFDDGLRDMVYRVREDSGQHASIKTIVEYPKLYPHSRNINPDDLITLAVVSGACSILGPVRLVHPREWKGAVPKGVSHERVQKRLGELEVAVLSAGLEGVIRTLQHNVMDAVGIGVWWRDR